MLAAMTFPVRNQMVTFKAKRVVSIPYRELGCSGEDYVKEIERVVRVSFPDSSRIEYLGDGSWRSQLKPITFFNVSATPVCYLRVYYKQSGKVLQLESDKLVLEFIGFPPGVEDLNFKFSLAGDLRSSQSTNTRDAVSRFYGSVYLGLECELPLPFSLMPEGIVVPVGDGILERILGAMENALLKGLVTDYKVWCGMKAQDKKQQAATTRQV